MTAPPGLDLYLVRHGMSVGNRGRWVQRADTPLAPEGIRQAGLTAVRLARTFAARGTPPTALYSSDFLRAWETATIIGAALGLIPIPEPGLREKAPGQAEGRTYDELVASDPGIARYGADFTNLDWGWPGGETRRAMRDRTVAAMAAILARHRPGDQVLVVTHGGPIWAYLTTIVPDHAPQSDSGAEIGNCSVTHLRYPAADTGWGPPCLVSRKGREHLAEMEAVEASADSAPA